MCSKLRYVWISAIAFMIAIVFVLGCWSCVFAQPTSLVGSRAPEIRAVGVKSESIQVPVGGDVTVVVFWNSKYRLSLDALAAMQRIWETYGDRGVRCVGFNDMGEEDRAVRQLTEQMSIGFSVASGRASSAAAAAYKLRGVPAVFVIDRAGIIVHVKEGWDRKAESEIREIVSKNL